MNSTNRALGINIAAAAAVILIGFVLFILYESDPWYLRAPSDASVRALFASRQQDIVDLSRMAREDQMGYISSSNLEDARNPLRRAKYENLFSRLPAGAIITRGVGSTRLILISAGMAAFGSGWSKGIEVFDDTSRLRGEVIANLDHPLALPDGNVFLVKIDDAAYIFLQKT